MPKWWLLATLNFVNLAPVAVFAWKRPEKLRTLIESLLSCPEAPETDVTVFVDGPRTVSDIDGITAVERLLSVTVGFRSLRVVKSASNLGLSSSLTSGVSRLVTEAGRVIVLEDDLQVSRHFLRFMNDHLDLYADDARVASIHAYVYPHTDIGLPDTFFIRGADCWGWATWNRAWSQFNDDGEHLLSELRRRRLIRAFDFDGTAPYEDMLIDQIAGRNDSWAIKWYASALLAGMLTLYPCHAMAINTGEDGTGTHRGSSRRYAQTLAISAVIPKAIPVQESRAGLKAFKAFFRSRYHIPPGRLGRASWRLARRVRARMRR